MVYAAACKAVYPSSILGVASRILDPTAHPLSRVGGVHVLICNRSSSKGRFTASVLRQFPDVEVVGSFQSDDDIRGALLSVPFDVCVLGPSFLEKKFDLDTLAPGATYPVRKHVMMTTNNTAESLILAHQLGLNDVIDLSVHMGTLDDRLRRVLEGEVDLARITSLTDVVGWLRPGNVATFAQDDMDLLIMMHLVEGRTNEEIAMAVHLALQTVRNRISRLMKAAGVSNRTQLATKLLR